MAEQEKLRLDKYLWAIRMFKTRAAATAACGSGKVKCNGGPVKASRQVHPGDELEIKTESKRWRIQVLDLLDHRVQFAEAVKHYVDLTPAVEIERMQFLGASFHTGKRLSKSGRPTKKQRRDLEDFTGNPE